MSEFFKPAKPPQVAVCECGKLLIHQLYMQELQLLCLNCGRAFQQPPHSQDETPESEAKWQALESEFMTHCGSKLVVRGMYRVGCAICDADVEPHIAHASDDDWRECNDAIKWLSDRTGREFRLINGILVGAGPGNSWAGLAP